MGLGNVLGNLYVTLAQGNDCGIGYEEFVCLHDKVRTAHLITTKISSYISLGPSHAYYPIVF